MKFLFALVWVVLAFFVSIESVSATDSDPVEAGSSPTEAAQTAPIDPVKANPPLAPLATPSFSELQAQVAKLKTDLFKQRRIISEIGLLLRSKFNLTFETL